MPVLDASQYRADATLLDGTCTHIRAIRPDDKTRLLDAFLRLSGQSAYFRFFAPKKGLSIEELRYFTEPDFVNHVGLVATLYEVDEERIIGVGRYIALEEPRPGRRAEVAFAVDDAHQGLSVGTLLLRHLAPLARANGIGRFEADVLADNARMLDVFAHSAFDVKQRSRGGVVRVSFAITRGPRRGRRGGETREKAQEDP